jgi:hypothetical protein
VSLRGWIFNDFLGSGTHNERESLIPDSPLCFIPMKKYRAELLPKWKSS